MDMLLEESIETLSHSIHQIKQSATIPFLNGLTLKMKSKEKIMIYNTNISYNPFTNELILHVIDETCKLEQQTITDYEIRTIQLGSIVASNLLYSIVNYILSIDPITFSITHCCEHTKQQWGENIESNLNFLDLLSTDEDRALFQQYYHQLYLHQANHLRFYLTIKKGDGKRRRCQILLSEAPTIVEIIVGIIEQPVFTDNEELKTQLTHYDKERDAFLNAFYGYCLRVDVNTYTVLDVLTCPSSSSAMIHQHESVLDIFQESQREEMKQILNRVQSVKHINNIHFPILVEGMLKLIV